MPYIAAIILFILTLWIDLTTDLKLWKSNNPIDHKQGAVLRALGLIPVVLLLKWYSIPMVLFTYWFLFDGLFNTFRRLHYKKLGYTDYHTIHWWFTGSDDLDEAKTDDFLQGLSLTQHKLVKVVGITISTIAYIAILVKQNF